MEDIIVSGNYNTSNSIIDNVSINYNTISHVTKSLENKSIIELDTEEKISENYNTNIELKNTESSSTIESISISFNTSLSSNEKINEDYNSSIEIDEIVKRVYGTSINLYELISILDNYNTRLTIDDSIDEDFNTLFSTKECIINTYNTKEERNYLINENYNTKLITNISNIDVVFNTELDSEIKYNLWNNTSLDYESSVSSMYNTDLSNNQIVTIDSGTNISKETKYSENYITNIELRKTHKIDQNNNAKVILYSKTNNISNINFAITKSIDKDYNTSSEYLVNEDINYNTNYERYSELNNSYNTSESKIQDLSIEYNTELDTAVITYPVNDNYNTKAGIRSKLNREYNTFVLLNIKEEDDEDMSADVLVNLYVDNQRVIDTCKNLIDKTGVTIATQARNSKSYNVIDMTNASHTGILIKNDLDINNEAFTIGYWAKSTDTSDISIICVDIESADLATKIKIDNGDILKKSAYSVGYETSDSSLKLNLALLDQDWHYITFCRVKNSYTVTTENDTDSFLVFIDGKKLLTVPIDTNENFDNKKCNIGYNADVDKRFIGYIDDYILVKNAVLHEEDFTTTPNTYVTKTVRDTILNTTTKSFKSVGTSASDVSINQRNDSDTIDILSLHNTFNIVNN